MKSSNYIRRLGFFLAVLNLTALCNPRCTNSVRTAAVSQDVGLIFSKEEEDKRTIFIAQDTGAPFYSGLEHGTIISYIPFGRELPKSRISYDHFYKIRYESQIGFVLKSDATYEKPYRYFKVISREGLNIREAPDKSSRRKGLVPFEKNGRIVSYSGIRAEIQNRHGEWILIQFGAISGYVFSGFVLISDSESRLNEIFEGYKVKFRPVKLESLGNIDSPVQTYLPWREGWDIVEVRQKGNMETCDYKSSFKKLYFINSRRKSISYSPLLESYVSDTRLMDRGILIADGAACHCCCGSYNTLLYSLNKGELSAIPFYYGKNRAMCNEFGNPETEARITPKRLFYHIRNPICFSHISENSMAFGEGETQFVDQKFFVLEKDGSHAVYDKMPSEYANEWDKAALFLK